jgi:hypothetical protein
MLFSISAHRSHAFVGLRHATAPLELDARGK